MALFGVYTDTVALLGLAGTGFLGIGFWITGIGRKMILRVRQQWKHKKGGYANTLFVHKNGTAEEIFKKVDVGDKSLVINGDKYVIDRKNTILYDGIPTMLHFEGISEPQEWNDPTGMSTGELQQIIENNKREGFIELLKQYWPLALTLVAVVVILALVSLYFNWQIFDIIVQQGTGELVPR